MDLNKKSISAGRVFTRKFEQIKQVYKRLSWVGKAGFSVEETCGLRVKVRELRSGVHKESFNDSSEHMAHFIYLAPKFATGGVSEWKSSGSAPFRGRHDRVHVLLCVAIFFTTMASERKYRLGAS